MNAKQWLMRARNIDREIDGLIAQRDEVFTRLTHITQSLTGSTVQSTKDPHKYDRLIELDAEIDRYIDELLDMKAEINKGIHQLSDGRYREILRRRYLSGDTLEQIAVGIGYSYKQTCRLHGRALLKMEEVINDQRFNKETVSHEEQDLRM